MTTTADRVDLSMGKSADVRENPSAAAVKQNHRERRGWHGSGGSVSTGQCT